MRKLKLFALSFKLKETKPFSFNDILDYLPPLERREALKLTRVPGAQPEIFQGRGGFVKLGHFHKRSVKNSRKKGPAGKISEFLLLDTLRFFLLLTTFLSISFAHLKLPLSIYLPDHLNFRSFFQTFPASKLC